MGNKDLLSPHLTTNTPHESSKRDRPLSSFLESPSDGIDGFLQKQQQNEFQYDTDQDDEDGDQENVDSDLDTPINNRKNKLMIQSPLMNRKPFRNLSNLMTLQSMKQKTRSFLKGRSNGSNKNTNECNDTNDKLDIDDVDPNETVSTIEDLDINDDGNDGNDSNSNNDNKIDNQAHKIKSSNERHKASLAGIKNPPARSLRRFHSMYQTNKEKDVILKDNSILHESDIKYFHVDSDLIPRIDQDSFYKLINDNCRHNFDDIIIIDCRFDYEYEGGHIKEAINISNKQELENRFINNDKSSHKKSLIIFHCEFSLFRGPTMASHLRKSDRILNFDNYPNLKYPDILILDGGYKQFYEKFSHHCYPQNYVEMKDIKFNKKCDTELHRFRSFSKLNDHSRSNSYTTITSHAENLKILKRQKSISNCNLKLTRASTFSYSNSVPNSNSTSNLLGNSNEAYQCQLPQEDFQPPIPVFQRSNKSSNSINSLNSSLSELSTFSSNESSDSVSISNSPVMEMNEFFSADNASNNNSTLTLNFTKPPLQSNNSGNSTGSSSVLSNPSSGVGTSSGRNSGENSISSIGSFNSISSFGGPPSTMKRRSKPMTNKSISSDFRFPNNSPTRSINGGSTNGTNTNGANAMNAGTNNSNINSKTSYNSPYRRSTKTQNHHNLMINTTATNSSYNHSHNHTSSLGGGHNNNFSLISNSSPIISSPLSNLTNIPTPISTIDTSMSNNQSSLIDPINDTPVDFQVPYLKKYRSNSNSNSNFQIPNLRFGDIDEDEEL